MKILLTVAYDGTNFFGWQKQNEQITIQEELENALSKVYGKPIAVRGASRTDTGVHAKGQRAMFEIEQNNIPLHKLPLAINNQLPRTIKIFKAVEVPADFHPQYQAKNKTYVYQIYNANILDPVYNNYAWHVKPVLDIKKMQAAAQYLIGEHDFNAFCAAGSSVKSTIRTIYSIDISQVNNLVTIRINGNGFLYNMVRILAGTLSYIGYGKLSVGDMQTILASKDRTTGGITAPPEGLSLLHINYDLFPEEQNGIV